MTLIPRWLQCDDLRTLLDHLQFTAQTLQPLLTQFLFQILGTHFQTFLHNLDRLYFPLRKVVQVEPPFALLFFTLLDELDLLLLHGESQLLVFKCGIDDRVVLRRVICHDWAQPGVCSQGMRLKLSWGQAIMRLVKRIRKVGIKGGIGVVDTVLFFAFHNSHCWKVWVHLLINGRNIACLFEEFLT